MLRTLTVFLFSLSVALCAHSNAWAQTCVVIDKEKDALTDPEQFAATISLGESLRAEGLQVSDAPCPDTYTLFHRPFGESVVVVVSGKLGKRMHQASAIETLPDSYDEIARSLVKGTKLTSPDMSTKAKSASAANDGEESSAESEEGPQTPAHSLTGEWSIMQITSLRYGRLLDDKKTDLHIALGQASISGCAAQAPHCETGLAISAGARRYLSTSRAAFFLEGHLIYLHEGIRFSRQETVALNLGAGLIRRSRSRKFHLAAGLMTYIYDKDNEDNENSDGIDLGTQLGVLIEFGRAF